MKALLGHDGPPTSHWRENLITGKDLAECPLRTLLRAREASPQLVAEFERYDDVLFPAYEEGHLLVHGGIADQPARYLEMIRLFRNTQARVDVEYEKATRPKDPAR